MERKAHLVEGAEMDPWCVIGTEAAGEDHRAEAVEPDRRGRIGAERRRIGHVGRRRPAALAPPADRGAHVVVAGVTEGDRFGQVRRKPRRPALGAEEVPQQGDPDVLEDAEVEVVAPAVARRLHVCAQSRRRRRQR